MHRTFGPGVVITAIGLLLSPQQPSSAVSTGSVVATVLEAGTRRPVAGALVTVGTRGVKTGSDGRARVDGVNTGSSWVHASADEHLSALVRSSWTMVGRPPRPAPDIPPQVWAAHNPDYPGTLPVTIKDGATTEVEFALPRGGVIAGIVQAPDGQPVAGARVDILQVYEQATDLRIFATAASATTDRNGAFRVSGLGPGEHYVRVIREPEARSPRAVPVFHTSVSSPLKATPIIIRPGETNELRIAAGAVTPVSIKGVVLDASGQRMRGETRYHGTFARSSVDLSYEHLDERCCSDVRSHILLNVDGQGRFDTGPLIPGTYKLRSGPYSVVTVLDTTPVENLVLQHHAPATIKGRVWPRPGWGQDWSWLTVALNPLSRTLSDFPSSSTSPAPDGTFAFGAVPGTYRLSVHTPDGWAVERAHLDDGRDVTDAELTVAPGAILENMTVTLTDRIARIAGRVIPLDLHGPYGFEVIAFPAAREHWHDGCPLLRTASTDEADELFVVEKLLPGHDYFVALQPWGVRRRPMSLERSLEELSRSAVRVSVTEPRTYRVEVDLQSRR